MVGSLPDASAPAFKGFLVYLLLSLTCGPYHVWTIYKHRRAAAAVTKALQEWQSMGKPVPENLPKAGQNDTQSVRILSSPAWVFLPLALLDVQGHYLVRPACWPLL